MCIEEIMYYQKVNNINSPIYESLKKTVDEKQFDGDMIENKMQETTKHVVNTIVDNILNKIIKEMYINKKNKEKSEELKDELKDELEKPKEESDEQPCDIKDNIVEELEEELKSAEQSYTKKNTENKSDIEQFNIDIKKWKVKLDKKDKPDEIMMHYKENVLKELKTKMETENKYIPVDNIHINNMTNIIVKNLEDSLTGWTNTEFDDSGNESDDDQPRSLIEFIKENKMKSTTSLLKNIDSLFKNNRKEDEKRKSTKSLLKNIDSSFKNNRKGDEIKTEKNTVTENKDVDDGDDDSEFEIIEDFFN
jgi:hypothetical protein